MTTKAVTERRVIVFAIDGVQSLDITGPAEVLAVANRFRPRHAPAYRIELASLSGQPIKTHAGYEIGPCAAIASVAAEADMVLVCGGGERPMMTAMQDVVFLEWLRLQAGQARRLASICSGALLLGAAGLLKDKRATTHWNLHRFLPLIEPTVKLEPDAIFVAEPPIYTSAGVTAGIDLAMAFVEEDLGTETARAVARELVLFLRRPGGQSQFSAGIQTAASTPRLKTLLADIIENPAGDLSVPTLAARVGQSERHFARRFRVETGTTPAAFVEAARVERVKLLLETTDWPLARIADRSGFGSLDMLHRSFLRKTGITPGAYRQRFGGVGG